MTDYHVHLICSNCLRDITGKGYTGNIPEYEDIYLYCSKDCAHQHSDRLMSLTALDIPYEDNDGEY